MTNEIPPEGFIVNPLKKKFEGLRAKPWDYYISKSEAEMLKASGKYCPKPTKDLTDSWQQLAEAGGKEGRIAKALLKMCSKIDVDRV